MSSTFDIALLYRVDLVLLSITGLFVVAKLPQAIALFGTTSEWFDGHFLHYVPYSPSDNRSFSPPSSKSDLASNISYPFYSPATQRVPEKGNRVRKRYPPHVGTCIKFLRPILTLLRLRISSGFSVAQSLLYFIYFVCLVFATIYRSNIFTDQTRSGWVVAAQLPFIFLLSQKNSVLGLLLGCGHEKVTISQPRTKKNPEISDPQLNFLHRFAGILVVIAANIHALCLCEFKKHQRTQKLAHTPPKKVYYWSINGTLLQKLVLIENIWGLVALISVDLMCFFSMQYWRERAYNIFLRTHIAGFILVPLAVGSFFPHEESVIQLTLLHLVLVILP